MTPVAQNYLSLKQSQEMAYTIENASSLYPMHTDMSKAKVLTENQYLDDHVQDLIYVAYPNHVKPFVSKTHTAMDCLRDSVKNASVIHANHIRKYTAERHISNVNKEMAFRANLRPMIKAAFDTETLTLTDPVTGKVYSRIMEFGVAYSTAGGATFTNKDILDIGQKSKDKLLSSGLIGIDDKLPESKELRKLMDAVGEKIRNGQSLNKEERLVAQFVTRLGDEGTKIEYSKSNKWTAYVRNLTNKSESEYFNFENWEKGKGILYDLGKYQYNAAQGYNRMEERFIKNLAYMASDDVSFIEGKNAERFDLPIIGQTIFKNKKNLELYRDARKVSSALPIEELFPKVYDPDAISRQVSNQTVRDFILEMFKGHPREEEVKHFMKQETWAEQQNLSDLIAHFAAGDAKILSKITDDPNSPLRLFDEAIRRNKTDINFETESFFPKNLQYKTVDGMIVHAKTTGSPSALAFNNDIFGYVQYANGNVYYSDGTMYNAAQNKHFTQNQYVRSLWNQNGLYDIVSSEVIDPDVIQDPRIAGNRAFAGQNILHLQMRLHKPYEDMPDYEDYLRDIHIFVPSANAEEEFFNNFGVAAYRNKKNNIVMTDYGRKLPHNLSQGATGSMKRGKLFTSEQKPFVDTELAENAMDNAYTKMAEMRLKDNAERSLTKYTPTSMDHIFEYQKLLNDGTTPVQEKNKQLVSAITKAAVTKDKDAYRELSQLTGMSLKDTKKFVGSYVMDGEFNAAWLRNTAEAARVMEQGSLLEQFDRITRKAISAHGKYSPDKNSDLYSLIMKRMTKFVMKNKDMAQIDDAERAAMIQYRLENQQNKFFINMEHYLKKFSIGTPFDDEDISDRFLQLDLEDTSSTINRILSMNKIPKASRESKAITRATVLDTIRAIAESPEASKYKLKKKDSIVQKYFKVNAKNEEETIKVKDVITRMLTDRRNSSDERNAYDLMQDVIDMFKTVRKRNYWQGSRATDFEPVLSSVLTKAYDLTDEQLNMFTGMANNLVVQYEKNGGGVTVSPTSLTESLRKALVPNFARIDEMKKEGSDIYKNYMADQRFVLAERMRLDLEALDSVNKTLVNLVHDSGGQIITMPGNRVMVRWGNAKWEDISSDLIHIETNEAGSAMFRFGPSGAMHKARGIINFSDSNAFALEFQSSLGYANRLTGVYKNDKSEAYKRILQNIQEGMDPRQAIEKGYLSKIRKNLGRLDLASTSAESNMAALMTADMSPLFYAKKLQERLPEWENYFKNDPLQLERIDALKSMVQDILENKKSEEEVIQFAQKEGIIGLFINSNSPFYIENGMLNNKPKISLQVSAYEKSNGLPIGIAGHIVGAENYNQPGKQVGKFITNTVAFNAEQNLWSGSNIIMAPGVMSKAEQNLAVYAEEGLYKTTNAIQVPMVETNPYIKEEILRQINNLKTNIAVNGNIQTLGSYDMEKVTGMYYERAARIVGKRMNITEGGALANGYLLDQLDMPVWGSRVVTLNGRKPRFRNAKETEKFLEKTGFKFENGIFSYGQGYTTKYDESFANFIAEFGSSESASFVSSGPSYATMEYVTKEGNVPMSAEAVMKAVEKKTGKKVSSMTQTEFEGYADNIFKRALINRSFEEQGHYKWFVEFEKGVGATTTAFLGNLFHQDDIISELQKLSAPEAQRAVRNNAVAGETLLYNILNDKAWDTVQKSSGLNFRGSVALSRPTYSAIQHLDFTHPLFGRLKDGESDVILNSLYQHMIDAGLFGTNATVDTLTDVDRSTARTIFSELMGAYRNSINKPLSLVTDNAYIFTESLMPAAKHGNSLNLLNGTVQFIREDLIKTKQKSGATAFLREAIEKFDTFGAIVDESGHLVKLADFLPVTGDVESLIIPNFPTRLNYKAIQDGIKGMNLDVKDLEDFLGTYRNFQNGVIKATMGTLGIVNDDANSLKTLKLTDREIGGLYSALWTEESLQAVASQIDKDFGTDALEKKFFSKYAYLTDAAQKNKVAGEQLIDYIENDLFFSRFGLNTFGTANSSNGYGSSVMAAKLYSPKTYKKDPYRKEKTEKIVQAIKDRLGNNRYISQSAVDDLYVASSEQAADAFNRLKYKTEEAIQSLVSDNGKNTTNVGYFKQTSINDISLFKGMSLSTQMTDPLSDFRKNTIWNMTDADIGLTESVLGQNAYVAVAGANPRNYKNLNDMVSANKQQAILNQIYNAKEEVRKQYQEDFTSTEYKESVERYKELLNKLTKQVRADAMGKEENSTLARLTEMYAPASVSGKVQVTDTATIGTEAVDALGNKILDINGNPIQSETSKILDGRTYKGEKLTELMKKGRNVNYMIIGEENLAAMGFNDQYFKDIANMFYDNKASKDQIKHVKEKWMENARTKGIAGIGHRWPSIYWGSDMAVQVYVDNEIGKGVIHMDAITAAAMKADADGDRAQAMLLGATQGNGRFFDASVFELAEEEGIDLSTKSVIKKGKRGKVTSFTVNSAKEAMTGHSERMLHQIYYDNEMFSASYELKKSAIELLKKKSKTDLYNESFIPTTLQPLTAAEAKKASDRFMQYQGEIADALEKVADSYKGSAGYKDYIETLKEFRNAKDGTSAFTLLSQMTSANKDLKDKLSQNITKHRKEINNAYIGAYKLYDADVAALQRVARGAAGVIDNPFTAAEMVRLELLETKVGGKPLLSAEESFAIQQMRTHIQEEFLTPKQMTPEGARSMGDLTRVTELMGNIFSGKTQKGEREELLDLLKKHGRPLEDRHQVGGMLKHFVDANGKLDDRKLYETALGGLDKAAEWVNNLSKEDALQYRNLKRIFSTVPNMVSEAHSRNTNMIGNRRTPSNIVNAILKNASGDAIQLPKDMTSIIPKQKAPNFQSRYTGPLPAFTENILRKAGSGGWSKNVMLLAGAVMMTGFVGGNPATPSAKQADQRSQLDRLQAGEKIDEGSPLYYEQNPPPSNIQLADPSLSPSGRKQPGYVININAQTQREKDYASRIITQAVTQNYHNTNVNVSMNVNQQPGNISGKEIADYIRQAF